MRILKFNNMQEFPALYDKEKIFAAVPVRFYNKSSADDIATVSRRNLDTITITFHTTNFTDLTDYELVKGLEKCVPNLNDVALFDFTTKECILNNKTCVGTGWSMVPNTKKSVIIATPFDNKNTNIFYRISTHGGMASWPIIIWRLLELLPGKTLPTSEGLLLAIELICGRHDIDIPNIILVDDLNKISTLLSASFITSTTKPRIGAESLEELTKIIDTGIVLRKKEENFTIIDEYFLSNFIGADSLPQVQWTTVVNDLEILNVTEIHVQNGRLFFSLNDNVKKTSKEVQESLSVILQIKSNLIFICRKVDV